MHLKGAGLSKVLKNIYAILIPKTVSFKTRNIFLLQKRLLRDLKN